MMSCGQKVSSEKKGAFCCQEQDLVYLTYVNTMTNLKEKSFYQCLENPLGRKKISFSAMRCAATSEPWPFARPTHPNHSYMGTCIGTNIVHKITATILQM